MILSDPSVHLYGPVLGLPALREEVATQWSQAYAGAIRPDQVAITAGCNQAYAAGININLKPNITRTNPSLNINNSIAIP